MKIISLEVENFARHAQVRFEPKGNIAAILGGNGSGKSSLLTALEFALTGQLPDPLETYVRQGEKTGWVEVHFSHQGRSYQIRRTLGKASKRTLTTPDEKLTGAREVDLKMSQILAVDKKTLGNAVFLRQGALTDILFSGYAERRSQLLTLTSLTYLNSRSVLLVKARDRVRSGIVDLGPALDQVTTNLLQAQVAQEVAETDLLKFPAATQELAEQRRTLLELQKLQQLDVQLSSVNLRVTGFEHQLAAEESRLGATVTKLREQIEEITRRAATLATEAQEYYRVLMMQQNLNRMRGEQVTQQKSMGVGQKELQALIGEFLNMSDMQATLLSKQQRLEASHARASVLERHSQAVAALQAAQKTLEALQPPTSPREALVGLERAFAQQSNHAAWLEAQVQRYDEIAGCIKPGETTCPKCGLEIKDLQPLLPENLERLRTEAMLQRQTANQTDQDRMQLQRAWTRYEVQKQQAEKEWQWRHGEEAALARAKAQLPPETESTEALKLQVAQLTKRVQDALIIRNTVTRILTETTQRQAEISTLEKQLPTTAASYTVEGYSALQQEHKDQLTLQRQKYDAKTLLTGLETELGAARGNRSQLTQQIALIPEHDLSLEAQAALPATIARLEAQQQAHHQARGVAQQARTQVTNLQQDLQTLQQRQQVQADKMALIKDLERLIPIFMDEGLALRCLQKIFLALQQVTRVYLTRLEARFILTAPDLETLELRYQVPGETVKPLPAFKLSGGMRVRLSLAFLLAVQRLLVPEVGLMVLDEPSTHLDLEGVQALAEMLQKLQSDMVNSGFSVWLADHHELLKTGVSDVLSLGAI